ncbi:MAG: glucokinase, partial [bacterium]
AVPHLKSSDLHTLNTGEGKDRESLAVIAPGTGLGEAFLTWSNDRYLAHPSEGGHADFAPATPEERELLGYLQERSDHVSVESVCSGRGIPNIYSFLKDTGGYEESDWMKESLADVTDPTPVIINAATDEHRQCLLCEATLEMFVSIMGSEAGNLALKVMATGGVFVGGGIPPRIVPALEAGSFMKAFTGKGRMRAIMKKIPVHVILNPRTALIGAACYGLGRDKC